MSDLLLPILPGDLGASYCFVSWQQTLIDFSNHQQAQLPNGRSFYNIGSTKPAPEFQAYPWLNTNDGRWYIFSGDWISPNPETSQFALRLFTGTTADLATYDGGDSGAPSDRSGPMWEVHPDYVGRVALGVGTVPGTTTPTITTSVTDKVGAAEHSLTAGEGAVSQHFHPFGVCDPSSDDAFLAFTGTNTVAGYVAHFVTGGGTPLNAGQTTANLYTLPSGTGGAGVATPTPFQTVPPAVATYHIRRTSRVYYKA